MQFRTFCPRKRVLRLARTQVVGCHQPATSQIRESQRYNFPCHAHRGWVSFGGGLALLDGKYEIIEELSPEGFLRPYKVNSPEGRKGLLYWFEVHSPEARTAFHRYRNALKRLEGLEALPAGLEISTKPGRYYVFWPEKNRTPVKKTRLQKVLEALEPFGYTGADLEAADEGGRVLLTKLLPLAGFKAALPDAPGKDPPRVVSEPEIPAPAIQTGKPKIETARSAVAKLLRRPPASRGSRAEARKLIGIWAWLPGLVSALLGVWALSLGVSAYFNPPEYTMPDLVGKTVLEAAEAVRSMGLRVEFSEGSDPTKPKDVVLDQSPEPGTRVKPGRKLSLVMNKPKLGTVPTLSGRSLEDALNLLKLSGYAPGAISQAPASATEGTVLATVPAAGTPLSAGQPVKLLVSSGPKAVRETVLPDLAGLTQREAEYLLSVAELDPVILRVASGAPDGQVVDQDPKAGTLLPRGASVRVMVAVQPEAELPEGSPLAQTQVVQPELSTGRQITVPLSLTLPTELEGSQVRVTVEDANGERVLFDGPAGPGWKLEQEVVVTGKATFRFYVNGQLYQEWSP